jgi:hypothetical protein
MNLQAAKVPGQPLTRPSGTLSPTGSEETARRFMAAVPGEAPRCPPPELARLGCWSMNALRLGIGFILFLSLGWVQTVAAADLRDIAIGFPLPSKGYAVPDSGSSGAFSFCPQPDSAVILAS